MLSITVWAKSEESVIKIAWAQGSCSAWDNKSQAIHSGLFLLSATTRISDGPAILSIPTVPQIPESEFWV